MMFQKANESNDPNEIDPFSTIVRIRLILDMIDNPHPHKHDHDENFNIENVRVPLAKLTKNSENTDIPSSILAYFPLHDTRKRNELREKWLLTHLFDPWKDLPIHEIKGYIGEKAGLYFVFTAHYTKWLVYLSIASIMVIIELVVRFILTGSFNQALLDSYTIPFYCAFVSFWAQLMIEGWKRKEARRAMEWGMTDFETCLQPTRHEYEGIPGKSYINGKSFLYVSPTTKFRLVCISNIIVMLMMLGVIGCVSIIFYLQYIVSEYSNGSGSSVVSVLSAIQVIVLNYLYEKKSTELTDMENHRTDTEYEDSLIGKLFAFSFVNSYASLFYVAFIKQNTGQSCTNGPCIVDLSYQLAVIFGKLI